MYSIPFYLVSYVSVPTSNLYVGGNLIGPSWKPSSTVSMPLAMFSCETERLRSTKDKDTYTVRINTTSTWKNGEIKRFDKNIYFALCFFNALYKTVAPSSMAFNIFIIFTLCHV